MTVSQIDGNGQEYMTMCIECSIDERGICNGTILSLENNYKKQTVVILLGHPSRGWKVLERRKDEVFSDREFIRWAKDHGYIEDESRLLCI